GSAGKGGLGNLMPSTSINFGSGGTSTVSGGFSAGASNTAGNISLTGTYIKVTGTVTSSYSGLSGASPNPFTSSAYSGHTINATGTAGGVITILEPGVSLTPVIYDVNADFSDTHASTSPTITAVIGGSNTFWVNLTPIPNNSGSAGIISGNSVT